MKTNLVDTLMLRRSSVSGTVALEACLRAFRDKPGDEVIVTRSFIASASVVLFGAVPVFCDVERDSQCIDPVDWRENHSKD